MVLGSAIATGALRRVLGIWIDKPALKNEFMQNLRRHIVGILSKKLNILNSEYDIIYDINDENYDENVDISG